MVRSSLARISLGGFSALLSVALLLMVGGLIASDRAMRDAEAAEARTDATQSALAVAQAVSTHLRSGGSVTTVPTDSTIRALLASAPKERSASAIIAGTDTLLIAGDRT